jgi:hypothetical protein
MLVHLHLYNGFELPEQVQEIDDWGPYEKTLGPFDEVQVTYGEHIKCYNFAQEDYLTELWIQEGFVVHENKYYGDIKVKGE